MGLLAISYKAENAMTVTMMVMMLMAMSISEMDGKRRSVAVIKVHRRNIIIVICVAFICALFKRSVHGVVSL